MTQPERKNPSSTYMGGSGQTFCGSFGLPDWQKQVVLDHNANMKSACYDGKLTSTCLDKS